MYNKKTFIFICLLIGIIALISCFGIINSLNNYYYKNSMEYHQDRYGKVNFIIEITDRDNNVSIVEFIGAPDTRFILVQRHSKGLGYHQDLETKTFNHTVAQNVQQYFIKEEINL